MPTDRLAAAGASVLCALFGLACVLVGGVVAWPQFRGVPGILVATAMGGLAAVVLRQVAKWPASIMAGTIGAMMAAYAAIASAEVFLPGSLEWALRGGAFGAANGVVIGGLLGLLSAGYRD